MTANPLRDELGTLDWNSKALSPVDQKDLCPTLRCSLCCTGTCRASPDDYNIVRFCESGFYHKRGEMSKFKVQN
jgi:hypothetical protein